MSKSKPCDCPKCGEHFESTNSMIRHRRTVHGLAKNVAKPYSWVCPICDNVFKTLRQRDYHRKTEHGKYFYSDTAKYTCQYCGLMCSSRRKLHKHYAVCEEKKKQPTDSLGRTYTEARRVRASEDFKRRFADGTIIRKPCSASTRKKISDIHKQRFANGLGKPWVSPWVHRSYAEQYFYDILSRELDESINWKNNYRVGRYLLDFANVQTKVYFEVDGETHYTLDGMTHDKVRTDKLTSLGWYLIGRIRWKDYTALEYTDKQRIVADYIKSFVDPNTNTNTIQSVSRIKRLSRSPQSKKCITNQDNDRHIAAYRVKRVLAESEGLIRSDGRISGTGTPLSEWNRRKDLILTCGVDLTQFGWVEKVIKCTGLSKRMIENTLNKFQDDFDGKYFRRKWNPVATKP